MGHYCKICGEVKPNEKFSGRGHAQHICKECAKLPREKKNEIQTINRIISLPFRLKKQQREWLEKMKSDPNEAVRHAAEWAWEDRFAPLADVFDPDVEFFAEPDLYEEPELPF